jgi:ABC-type antimicrobial peptide transport system permease subunit
MINSKTLFYAELKYRRRGSVLGSVAVAVAVISVSVLLHLLNDFDRHTQREIRELQHRSQERMDALENEARIFAKSLGFNILIYNQEQRLETFHADDVNTHFLTTREAHLLADAELSLLNHLLPFLRQRYYLPAFNGEVIIAGLKGEIYIKQDFQQPLEVSINKGEVQLGHSVAQKLGLKAGDSFTIGGKQYKVTLCRNLLGTKDDIVVFMNLADAQVLLKKEEEISGILALSCNCAAGDIEPIRTAVKKIIPRSEVVEFATRAKARQNARAAIKKAAESEVADIVKSRQVMRKQLERFSALFIAFIVLAVAILLFFLYNHNVKERRHEIAILRTLGARSFQIYGLFVLKAALLAVSGGVLGYMVALLLVQIILKAGMSFFELWSNVLFAQLLVSVCFVSILAGLIPVALAARRDPGSVLNEEL